MKYELTDEKMTTDDGVTLRRIRAIKAFRDVLPGDLGGWVETEANLSHDGEAWVFGHAKVYDNAKVFGAARVYDNANVFGAARVFGKASVYGIVEVFGDAQVFDSAKVYGEARVFDNAEVYDHARVYGEARVHGDAQVYGSAQVFSQSRVRGSARLDRFISANRSDGYAFVLLPMADGSVRVSAGCRFFSFEEARDHWTRTRGGTPLGDETMMILDYLERAASTFK